MHKSSFIVLLGLCLLMLAQCTIQKRVYRKGWYISFKKEWRNPGKEQAQEVTTDHQEKAATDLTSVADFSPAESPQPETAADDSSPNSTAVADDIETPLRSASPVLENEDTIISSTPDSGERALASPKTAHRPLWVKQLVIFLFLAGIMAMIVTYFLTVPAEITASFVFAVALIFIVLIVFLISLAIAAASKHKKPTRKPEKKQRLMTPEEQAEKKKERKREAIILTSTLGALFLLLVVYAFFIQTFVFLLPVGIAFAFFTIIAWFEYKRKRSSEKIEDEVIPEKISRQKTEVEKQAELGQHKRRSLISVIFWTIVLFFVILISIPFESAVFLWVMTAICLTFILVCGLEYFRWKPKDTVEMNPLPVPEEEPEIETPAPDEDEPVTQKPSKTPEEQRKINRKRNVVVGLFFATLITFFIFASNK
jgi:Na+-transporting methylmalonyl-CoA/oxaloacetate decarboxylase gamma subunit